MSIFYKVTILFTISFILMIFLSTKTNEINDKQMELIYKEKYLQISKEFFNYFTNNDMKNLNKRLNYLNYKQKKVVNIKSFKTIYEENISFGEIKIIKDGNLLYLYMKYFDDEIIFYDTTQENEFEQKNVVSYLIYADIFLLLVIFIIMIQILRPLKHISIAMESFGKGNYNSRLEELKSDDEIAKVVSEFNKMADNLETLHNSRIQFLNDISHELRTPIAKSKLAIEMLEDTKYKAILKKSLQNMDELTNELLEIERLNSNKIRFDFQVYSIETILAHIFSKMILEEENIDVVIENSFEINADINFISIAIKNLIDNALKYNDYTQTNKIIITVKNHTISVLSRGKHLTKELDFYTQTFTKDDNARSIAGFGLGLNIVKRVVDMHNFKLEYAHKDGYNIFSILFETQIQ